ncbi:efflux transporter outer membrane subunit [Zavarzinia aquatilis]|uniref:Transporter n=1 Tax=Zavarzinia aquatilis TaxID=2211142 RepID=A0A317E4G7_9PROT|nr:efflux transporter outer membrane subunit [Zavarzinia aquatilis]PWR20293.1 transporter [Zavarzinia aquatilis]
MDRRLLSSALALLLAGCGFTPEAPPRIADIPPAFEAAGPGAGQWPDADWWRGFGSPELDRLMAEARANNPDLAQAAARILQAEAQARIAGSSLWPSLSLSANGDARRGEGDNAWIDGYSTSLGASYEVDFWGANAASRGASAANLAASRFDRETVALTVSASVATSYLQILSLRDRLAVARQNLSIAEDVLALVTAKVGAGAAGELDLAQQRTVVAQRRAALPPLEQSEREARATLALLLGRGATGFTVTGSSLAPVKLPAVFAGLPADLLTRRPDLSQAESRLVAADADIAAARAAFFPQVTLNASMALQGAAFGDLFDLSSATYGLGASILQTIFDGGRLAAQQDLAEAQKLELVEAYRAAVRAAFGDAEVALGAVDALGRQGLLQDEVVAQARRALELAQIQYRAGAAELLTVLSAQQSLYAAEDQAAQIKLSRLTALVGLYRALGGGWQAGPG